MPSREWMAQRAAALLATGLCGLLLLLCPPTAAANVAEEPAFLTDQEALAEALRFAGAPLPPPVQQAAASEEARPTPEAAQLEQRLALLRAQLLEEPRRDVPAALRGYAELAARLEALVQEAAEQQLPVGWEVPGEAELRLLELPETPGVAPLADATFELATLRLTGLAGALLPRDEAAGVQLLRTAVAGGSIEAQLALSSRYLTGSGVPRDCEAAFRHGEAAAREFAAETEAAGAFPPPVAPLLLRERWANADFRPPLPGALAGGGWGEGGPAADDDEWEQLQRQQLDAEFGGWAPDPRQLGGQDALQALRRQAAGGDGEALFQLGFRALRGLGMTPNATAARVLFQAARLQGHPAAHNALGVLAHEGRGQPPDAAAARRHFAAGAAAGDPDAVFNLGLTLQRGGTGPGEAGQAQPEQALQHMLQANEEQHWQAPLELARMYHAGVGTAANCSTAMLHLGTFLMERAPWHDLVLEAVEHLDAGDEWRALVSLAFVAEQGCTAAQHNLAWALHTSRTFLLPERHSLALDLFLRAGSSGFMPIGLTDAAHVLWHGHKHQLPQGTNRTRALELWREAMGQGDTEAAFQLAAAHQAGAGVRRDLSAAAELYAAAVALAPAERFAAPPFLALQLLRLEVAWRLAAHRLAAAAAVVAQRDLAVLSALASGLAGVLGLLWQRQRVRRARGASTQH